MSVFNAAYERVFKPKQLTLGFMTPFSNPVSHMADVASSLELAALADRLGFAALWARDVPLMVPQGADNQASAVDDPFVWLTAIATATEHIAIGAAAIVSPLRHPLHVAKAALSIERISGGRFILGLGSGDRPEEFAAFDADLEERKAAFQQRWALIQAALRPDANAQQWLREQTGGYDLMTPPERTVPMLVVGSARQSVQWIAEHAQAWATYHREASRQHNRIRLWHQALEQRASGEHKPFIQSLQLDLQADPSAEVEAINLGMRCGRVALIAYLKHLHELGVGHVLINIAENGRSPADVISELGMEVLPALEG
ncbi:MAG TPA: TIGR03571 family LLM class oxidoreductase [Paenalcaligenes sp.]|nr:TIGR03571 family LLM class oxidoreductase [Paenalcaligenes sp.]